MGVLFPLHLRAPKHPNLAIFDDVSLTYFNFVAIPTDYKECHRNIILRIIYYVILYQTL